MEYLAHTFRVVARPLQEGMQRLHVGRVLVGARIIIDEPGPGRPQAGQEARA